MGEGQKHMECGFRKPVGPLPHVGFFPLPRPLHWIVFASSAQSPARGARDPCRGEFPWALKTILSARMSISIVSPEEKRPFRIQ